MNDKSSDWIVELHKQHKNLDVAALQHARDLISEEENLQQGHAMVNELIKLNCDNDTLVAALIYPAFYTKKLSKETLSKQFNSGVYKLTNGTLKMEAIHGGKNSDKKIVKSKQHADNLRRMLLAMVGDIRVVLIKLAERITTLRLIKDQTPEIQQQIAAETMEIYAPLANRLGIGQFKWLLEDLSFRYLEPKEYQTISKKLNMRREVREQFIDDMIQQLTNLFKQSAIEDFSVTGRAKHIFSISKKLSRKGVEEIFDTSAFRVLVPTVKDCYTALSVVHATWQHIPTEFDDYIAKPKPNGYRSIHTAVIGPNNINVEIQIRTYKMHEESELGVAAHWKYKEGHTSQTTYEEKISLLREMMDWQKELSADDHSAEESLRAIFEDRVYIFTPNGDIFDLEAGATPLDFAYHVHTDVGHRCRGAKVNDVLVPLTHQLNTGDVVNILTAKENKPSRDWLNPNLGYIKTPTALAKIRHHFAKIDRQQNLSTGLSLWEKAHRKSGVSKAELQKSLPHFNFKTLEDLFIALGSGHLTTHTILHFIEHEKGVKSDFVVEEKITESKVSSAKSSLDVQGVGQLLTQFAKCCKPIPGDSILGYITKGYGISIHQSTCANIQNALKRNPERIIELNWGEEMPTAYPVDVIITATDREALIRDISTAILNEKLPLLGIQTQVIRSKNFAYIEVTIEITAIEQLQNIINTLKNIPGVRSVTRR